MVKRADAHPSISQARSFVVTMEGSPWSVNHTISDGIVTISLYWADKDIPTHQRILTQGESLKFLEFMNAKDNQERG